MRSIYLLISIILMVTADYPALIINKDNLTNEHHWNQVETINFQSQKSTIPISSTLKNKTVLAQTKDEISAQSEQSENERWMVIILFASFLFLFVSSGLIALGGITEKIKVKEGFLRPLFFVALIEGLFPTVLALGRPGIIFPSSQYVKIQNLENQINSLTEKKNDLVKIEKLLESELEIKVQKIKELKKEKNQLETQLEKEQKRNVTIDKSFFGKIAKMDDYAASLDDQNFYPEHNPDVPERRNACKVIQELLKSVGKLQRNRDANNDCFRTSRELKKYQTEKGMIEKHPEKYPDSYYPVTTSSYLVIDYLQIKGLIE